MAMKLERHRFSEILPGAGIHYIQFKNRRGRNAHRMCGSAPALFLVLTLKYLELIFVYSVKKYNIYILNQESSPMPTDL